MISYINFYENIIILFVVTNNEIQNIPLRPRKKI